MTEGCRGTKASGSLRSSRKRGCRTAKTSEERPSRFTLWSKRPTGYRAVFALPELDPDFNDRVILLADRRDGQALSAKDGPLQIIVPGEKRHSRGSARSSCFGSAGRE